jgi:phosphoesterase RecJ-like protein
VINLDHHATNIMFGDVFLVDPQAVSATQVVFSWLDYMDVALNEDISAPLLTGLLTDTIGFRTNNCSTTTLEIAQQLMQAGASLPEITARALDSRSILQVNLWKHALPSVELHKHGVIVAEVRQQDIKRAGLNELTDGGLVGFLNQVKEAVIAIVFKERNDGDVEISMRAKTGYDVSQIALELGGGGHKQAAGATIPGPVEEARKRVLPMLKDAAKRGTPTFG